MSSNQYLLQTPPKHAKNYVKLTYAAQKKLLETPSKKTASNQPSPIVNKFLNMNISQFNCSDEKKDIKGNQENNRGEFIIHQCFDKIKIRQSSKILANNMNQSRHVELLTPQKAIKLSPLKSPLVENKQLGEKKRIKIKKIQSKKIHKISGDRFIPSRKLNGNHKGQLSFQVQKLRMESEEKSFVKGNDLPSIKSLDVAQLINLTQQDNLLPNYLKSFLTQSNEQLPSSFQNPNMFKFVDYYAPKEQVLPFYTQLNDFAEKLPPSRDICKTPFKVLDAPQLQDDFYLNLLDWSVENVVSVALSQCVYLWHSSTNKVVKFCDYGQNDVVTSVSWSPNGQLLSVGLQSGGLQIYDNVKLKKICDLTKHSARIGSIAWGQKCLATGSKDKQIWIRDYRQQRDVIQQNVGHKQEVCGLKWAFDEETLASGGNDNKLFIWKNGYKQEMYKFDQHTAAVKALAWSPHKFGLLVSGGGTADRTIRFWNTNEGECIDTIDTGSQVCNLIFSKNCNEFISTHGYSMNQISIWKYPEIGKICTLTGHTSRVLYLAMSPDGQTIVTGAGDETLRFWNVFEPKNQKKQENYLSFADLR